MPRVYIDFVKFTKSRKEKNFQQFHPNVCGPFTTPAFDGPPYFVCFIDHFAFLETSL